ncbi:hypothetical protein ACGC1H_000350 [Rhizoctonia solani]
MTSMVIEWYWLGMRQGSIKCTMYKRTYPLQLALTRHFQPLARCLDHVHSLQCLRLECHPHHMGALVPNRLCYAPALPLPPLAPTSVQQGVNPPAPMIARGPIQVGSHWLPPNRPIDPQVLAQPLEDAIPPRRRTPSPTPEASKPEPDTYQVMVRHEWTPSPVVRPSGSRGGRPSTAKQVANKPLELVLADITRAGFVMAILRAHDLDNEYHISAENAPPFRICWKGSPGGERNPITIETNSNFDTIMNQLRHRPSSVPVTAIFCTDDMQAWWVRKRGVPNEGFEENGRDGPNNRVCTRLTF